MFSCAVVGVAAAAIFLLSMNRCVICWRSLTICMPPNNTISDYMHGKQTPSESYFCVRNTYCLVLLVALFVRHINACDLDIVVVCF